MRSTRRLIYALWYVKKKKKMGYIKFFLGTCKIDKNCTCTIKLIERENGIFVSEVYRSHYGNKSQFGHIWLTTSTRQQISAKLQQGISKEKILDDNRESVSWFRVSEGASC